MKVNAKILVIVLFTTFYFGQVFGQTENKRPKLDGLYVAKTGEVNIPKMKMEIFTYILFFEDGTVITQSVNSYDPKAVSKWFKKDGNFERIGKYKVKNGKLTFTVSNEGLPDKKIEGLRINKYEGLISDNTKLVLKITYDGETEKEVNFEYVEIK